MCELWLIRHGQTAGNRQKRYIGCRTDEPLCREGIEELTGLSYPAPELLVVSPMLRCRESADILFPETASMVVPELTECDFGRFENRNYLEMTDDAEYQAWIDSNGMLPFPGGESRDGFQERTLAGFRKVLCLCEQKKAQTCALVVHGGTIMNIMETCVRPHRDLYAWHAKNGHGFKVKITKTDEDALRIDAWESI